MSALLFNIVVCGVCKGFDPAAVKTRFSNAFKLDPLQVERVFKSVPIILRRNIPEDFANSLVKRLLLMGVLAQKIDVEAVSYVSTTMCSQDLGETASDASSMHQLVDYLYGEHTRRIPFIFSGNGFAYFKLWVVNLFVCILSAGILYPWARTRSLRYLYQHTSFDNVNLQCEENSQKVYFLQFFFMTFMFIIACSFLYSRIYFAIALALFIAAFPYYWFKRSQVGHGSFLFCGLTFQPITSLRDTYMAILVWPFLALVTAGFLIPSAAFNIHYSRWHKKSLGRYEFRFLMNPKKYWILLHSLLLAELVICACIFWRQLLSMPAVLTMIFALVALIFIHWQVALAKLQWNHLSSQLGHFVCSWTFGGYGKLIVKNLLLCLLTLGLYWPWAKISITKYKAENLAFFANQRFKKWRKELNF